jgi:hypothetical protein
LQKLLLKIEAARDRTCPINMFNADDNLNANVATAHHTHAPFHVPHIYSPSLTESSIILALSLPLPLRGQPFTPHHPERSEEPFFAFASGVEHQSHDPNLLY